MKYFAELNNNDVVLRVTVFLNSVHEGEQAEKTTPFSENGVKWIETFLSDNPRKNYAGVGHTYDESRNAFIAPKMYPSWVLNETTCQWEAPVAQPEGYGHFWDESSQSWLTE